MEPFQRDDKAGDGSLLTLRSWQERYGLTVGFSTRQAGNVALHVGDDPQRVVDNRRQVAKRLAWPFEAWTCAEQVHSDRVHIVTATDRGSGRIDRTSAIPSADALVTDEADTLLVQFFADCVPLYFYDPVSGACGLAHAGWKGTVAEIAVRTVETMSNAFGANPQHICVAIGPSIGQDRYEVDESVLRQVRPLLTSLPMEQAGVAEATKNAIAAGAAKAAENVGTAGVAEAAEDAVGYGRGILKPTGNGGRAALDLKDLNRRLMIKAGIVPSNIEITRLCTASRTDLFFSHRVENVGAGRMMSWLGRREKTR